MNDIKKKILTKTLIILFWLLAWELVARLLNNNIVLVPPSEVFRAFFVNLFSLDFLRTALRSLLLISLGFTFSMVLAIILGSLACKHPLLDELLAPLVSVIKTVPVASFVVILLIWAGSDNLSAYICGLIVFPHIYYAVKEGLKSCNPKLLEYAKVFSLPMQDRILFIYIPSVYPYFMVALKSSIGMAWKSGVAAEVIGMSKNTFGEKIYISKIYFDTADLFAWTLMVVLMSFLFEKLVLALVKDLYGLKLKPLGIKRSSDGNYPKLINVSKSYDRQIILKGLSMDFKDKENVMFCAPSGSGKTTLLRLLCGLEKADLGQIVTAVSSISFQEDAFIEDRDALTNVRLFADKNISDEEIKNIIIDLLGKDSLSKPLKEFSSGMRKRLSVIRALLANSDVVYLDEPFSTLDEDNQLKIADFIKARKGQRKIIFTGHNDTDADMLFAERINLWTQE